MAVCSSHILEIRRLCEEGHADKEATDKKYGRTPLHVAAGNGRLDVVTYLCETAPQANKEATNNDGETPLHAAAGSDRLEIVRYLCETAPRANKAARRAKAYPLNGWTPLQVAEDKGYSDIVEYLTQRPAAAGRPGRDSGAAEAALMGDLARVANETGEVRGEPDAAVDVSAGITTLMAWGLPPADATAVAQSLKDEGIDSVEDLIEFSAVMDDFEAYLRDELNVKRFHAQRSPYAWGCKASSSFQVSAVELVNAVRQPRALKRRDM